MRPVNSNQYQGNSEHLQLISIVVAVHNSRIAPHRNNFNSISKIDELRICQSIISETILLEIYDHAECMNLLGFAESSFLQKLNRIDSLSVLKLIEA